MDHFSKKFFGRVGGRFDEIEFHKILTIWYYLDLSRQHNVNTVSGPKYPPTNGRVD